jgi:HAD superfamily hydrolase (TIGR01509 family)
MQLVSNAALPLRPGVRDVFEDCAAAGVRMAVVTTTSRGNVQALLSAHLGGDWLRRFATIVGAEDAPDKKPDPQAYRVALERLGIDGSEALAIEDSPAGLRAATGAGVPCVITRSRYFPDDPVPGALSVGPGLGSSSGWVPAVADGASRVGLEQLRAWHAMMRSAPP